MARPLREMSVDERSEYYFYQIKQEQKIANKRKKQRSLREFLNNKDGEYLCSNHKYTNESFAEEAQKQRTAETQQISKIIFGALDTLAEELYSGHRYSHTIHASVENGIYSAHLRYPFFSDAWMDKVLVSTTGAVQISLMYLKGSITPDKLKLKADFIYHSFKEELKEHLVPKTPKSLRYSVEPSRR